jgi:MFS family permease
MRKGAGLKIFALICVFLGGMGQGVVNPRLPELLTDHARLALDSGISASLMYVGIFLASFLYGSWADRGNVFRLMCTGLVIYAGVLTLLCLASSKEQLFALRFLEGLGLSAVYVAADVVLCRGSTDATRGRWLSYYGLALSLGLLVGPVFTISLDWALATSSLTLSLYSLSALSLSFALAAFFLRMPVPPPAEVQKILNPRAGLAATLYGFLESGLVAVLAAVVVAHYQSKVEPLFLVLLITAGVASLGWGVLIDRIGPRQCLWLVFLSLALLSGITTLGHWLKPGEWVLFAGAVSMGIAAGGIYPAGFAWLVEGSHPSQYGYASGLFTRAYGFGSLLGPLCFGLAVEASGPPGLFGLAALLGAAGLVIARKASQVSAVS